MQKVKLPQTLDLKRAAQKRLDYSGIYSKEQMMRLSEAVLSLDSDIQCSMSLTIDSQQLTVLTGCAEVSLTQMCQRCNQPFPQVVNISYTFSPVRDDEQTEALPENYEPVDVNEFGEVDLLAVIEDEIILALPVVPKHDSEHCEVSDADMVFGVIPEALEEPNPFAVLASLKRK